MGKNGKRVGKVGGRRVVNSADLKWKSVEVPDTLDDFGGFYGLEEIDGVDVKIVNGAVQFVTVGEEQEQGEKKEPKQEQQQEEEEEEEEEELIEFKNLDDLKDGELSAVSSDESEDGQESDEEVVEDESHADSPAVKDGLKENVFSAYVQLDDISSVELPDWTSVVGELSLTTFHGLSSLGFLKPTPIQQEAIPVALKGEDIMGKASTGSGKTLAYGIPIIETLAKCGTNDKDPIGLIFTPTRELAQQVTDHIKKVAKLIVEKNPYSVLSLTGGLSIQKQQRLLNYDGSGRIVVATPGRFLELLEKDRGLIERFAKTRTLVLDEADRLLQDGHFDEFEKILKYLSNENKSLNKRWQTLIFSATFSVDLFDKLASTGWKKSSSKGKEENEMEIVLKHLMKKINFKSKPILIDMNPEQKVSSNIREALIECAPTERDLFCYYFVTMYPGQTLIFCNAIDSVKKLTTVLNHLKITSYQLHSSMTQKNRLKNLEKFQQHATKNNVIGKPTVLIASDVAARGLDISGIKHVIHYHIPRTADVYIHRSGRTARADNEGVSVMICSPEEAMGPLRKLRQLLVNKASKNLENKKQPTKWQKEVPLLPIDSDIVAQLRDRCKLAADLADHEIASASLKKDDTWMKKAAEDLGLEYDSDDEIVDTFLAKNKTKKKNKTRSKDETKGMRYQLNELLKKPIRKDMRQKYLTGGLTNLADDLIKKRGHDSIIGHDKIDALNILKDRKKKRSKN